MNIRGIYKTSLIDFPGRISAVLFNGGCNLRCRYCHNPELVHPDPSIEPEYTEDEILSFLEKRSGLLEGVVLTGGEPTIDPGLIPFLHRLRETGLAVKLDTNGFRPDVLGRVLEEDLVDYVAMDIKTSPSRYPELTGRDVTFDTIIDSFTLLRDANLDFELRTTCIPEYVTEETLEEAGEALGQVPLYYLQQFVNDNPLVDPEWKDVQPYPVQVLFRLCETVSRFAQECDIRGI
jgi:pyruvate formate lyase activating enzyme